MNTRQISSNSWKDRLKRKANKFVNSNGFVKFILFSATWIIALVPVWISWLFFWLLSPVGFWQTFATFSACVVIMIIPQGILAFFGVLFTIGLIQLD